MQYLHYWLFRCFKIWYGVKYPKLHHKNWQWLDYHPNCSLWNAISPRLIVWLLYKILRRGAVAMKNIKGQWLPLQNGISRIKISSKMAKIGKKMVFSIALGLEVDRWVALTFRGHTLWCENVTKTPSGAELPRVCWSHFPSGFCQTAIYDQEWLIP